MTVALRVQVCGPLVIDRGGDYGEIEQAFGGPLQWEHKENVQGCRIAMYFELGGYRDDESKWPKIQDAMIDAMIHLEKALHPHIAKLKVGP